MKTTLAALALTASAFVTTNAAYAMSKAELNFWYVQSLIGN